MRHLNMLKAVALVAAMGLCGSAFAQNMPDFGRAASIQATVSNVTFSGFQTCAGGSYTFRGSVTGTVDQGGGMDFISLEVWDEGVLITSTQVAVAVGATVNFSETLTTVGAYDPDAPGVGLAVYGSDGSQLLAGQDPFIPEDRCSPSAVVPPTYNLVPAGDAVSWGVLGMLAALGGFFALRRRA